MHPKTACDFTKKGSAFDCKIIWWHKSVVEFDASTIIYEFHICKVIVYNFHLFLSSELRVQLNYKMSENMIFKSILLKMLNLVSQN